MTNHPHQPPTTTWQDYQMGTHLPILRYIPFGNQLDYSMTHSTAIHVQSSTLGGPNRCKAAWQLSMPVSWKYYLLYFELCIHCFLQYTPNY